MISRTLLKHALTVFITLGLVTSALTVAAAPLQEGKDYVKVRPNQPTESGGKIEVLEFFSFNCPHCRDFEPKLAAWAKGLPKDVVVKRVPITFGRESWEVLARVYLTLEALGLADKLTQPVFQAIQDERLDFSDEVARGVWLKRNGVDPAKFADVFKSFSVQTQLQHAKQLAVAYQIQGVPSMAIDGKYFTSPALSQSPFEVTLAIASQLVVQARAERKPAPAPKKTPAAAASAPAKKSKS